VVTTPSQFRAISDRLCATILDLLLERAATVAELAAAAQRPKSTVAHHVDVLVDAEMLRVVRTRRVRAIDELYYGRAAPVVLRRGREPSGQPRAGHEMLSKETKEPEPAILGIGAWVTFGSRALFRKYELGGVSTHTRWGLTSCVPVTRMRPQQLSGAACGPH
jgi:DNA-binding transcriptional ArsR family regulator